MFISLTASVTAEGAQAAVARWNLAGWLIQEFDLRGQTAAGWIMLAATLLCMAVPYLLGSINPAILISKLVYHEDIREFGSGNAGSTNMLRTYGKKAAIATFLCDLFKAALAVIVGRLLFGDGIGAPIAGFFVAFGHMFPIFAHFRGGKGVACLAMVILMLSPITFLCVLGIFIVVAFGTRYISFASIMCAVFYPLLLHAFAPVGLNVAMAILSSAFVIYMHRANIKRIMAGTESKVSFSKISKKKKTDADAENADHERDGQ